MLQDYNPPISGMGGVPMQGLPPEYSAQLFQNLQAQNLGQKRAANQAVMDNTSRNPAMSGVQQMMLRQNGQDFADQALNQGRTAQLAGVNAAREDRQAQQQRDFTGAQNEANRQVEYAGQRSQEGMQRAGFENEAGVANRKQIAGMAGGVLGMLGGPALSGAGYALGQKMFGGDNGGYYSGGQGPR